MVSRRSGSISRRKLDRNSGGNGAAGQHVGNLRRGGTTLRKFQVEAPRGSAGVQNATLEKQRADEAGNR
jgi:hypothetical protein